MNKVTLVVLAACAASFAATAPKVSIPSKAIASKKPKLVVAIAVDQFRYDYLMRFKDSYTGGFKTLLTKGATFANARYEHFPTVTAIGHSTFLSGATPSMSGIVANEWYDRDSGKDVSSVSDDTVKMLGGKGDGGASPRRLLVSTLGDEMKIADNGQSKVIGISLKDRSAILPAGHMANGAYWFDNKSGNFVSSTFYFDDLPGWVKDFNGGHPADKFAGAKFVTKTMEAAGPKLYAQIPASPFGNELIESFAERAIVAEQLGKHNVTDLLTVSFSSNDYVGHALGPDSPEVKEISILTDKVLDKFFKYLNAQVGLQNVLIVLTADHGVTPLPELQAQRKMPGGRMKGTIIRDAVQNALVAKYGKGDWVMGPTEVSIYLNQDLIKQKKLDQAEVDRVAAQAAAALPHVFRVYTRERLTNGVALEDQVGRRVMNGFYARRSADVFVLLEPYWITSAKGTTHGTTFSYDSHVPVIFMGPQVKPGRYNQQIAPNDIAPTLSTILDVETPSGSVGRVLTEIINN